MAFADSRGAKFGEHPTCFPQNGFRMGLLRGQGKRQGPEIEKAELAGRTASCSIFSERFCLWVRSGSKSTAFLFIFAPGRSRSDSSDGGFMLRFVQALPKGAFFFILVNGTPGEPGLSPLFFCDSVVCQVLMPLHRQSRMGKLAVPKLQFAAYTRINAYFGACAWPDAIGGAGNTLGALITVTRK